MTPAPTPTSLTDPRQWNTAIQPLPGSHILQSWEWGQFKSRYGWRARRLLWEGGRAAAQVLSRSVRGLRVLYIPKGPLLDWSDAALRAQVLGDLELLARRQHAIFVKIDPDIAIATGMPGAEQATSVGEETTRHLLQRAWRFAQDQIQFRNTVVLDLRGSEPDILAGMKQKTRYNVRLAERKGVQVRLGGQADLGLLYRLYAETSLRDGFAIRPEAYYKDLWSNMLAAGLAQPFIAEAEGQLLSALILFRFGGTAWYMYGMSREAQREKMPNHLLQWEAIRWAKAQGCERYDFWGAPDRLDEAEAMWGVWKFKEGFGGSLVRHIGAWDYVSFRPLYWLYTRLLPRVLAVMRTRGREQTRTALE
jgi:lipid II:glycine glycyltransferase (peptidoglycan interpeptide bridge formation enzyme)